MKTKMSLSKELQLGKAGEHIVVADLILQGYNAFLSDQGLPYDLVVEDDQGFKLVQVRSTRTLSARLSGRSEVYRYGLRRARGNRVVYSGEIDSFAFVVLDRRIVGYVRATSCMLEQGQGKGSRFKQVIEFKTRTVNYVGRTYQTGKTRILDRGKFIEDYHEFKSD